MAATKRGHMLSNGDIFKVVTENGVDNLLFENGLMYKVIEESIYYNEKSSITHWRRTGKVYKAEEVL